MDQILEELRRYASVRKAGVMNGRESPEMAAQLIREYGNKLAKTVDVTLKAGSAAMVIYEADKLADELDDT